MSDKTTVERWVIEFTDVEQLRKKLEGIPAAAELVESDFIRVEKYVGRRPKTTHRAVFECVCEVDYV